MKRRFLAGFFGGVVLLYILIALNPVNDWVIEPFTRVVSLAAAGVLHTFHEPVTVTGAVMRSDGFALDVKNGCNAVDASIIFVAGIMAFPATLRAKVIGAICGLVLLHLVNIIRLAVLFWLGEHFRSYFELFHVAVWQAIVIAISVGLFIIWSSRFATPRASVARR